MLMSRRQAFQKKGEEADSLLEVRKTDATLEYI